MVTLSHLQAVLVMFEVVPCKMIIYNIEKTGTALKKHLLGFSSYNDSKVEESKRDKGL